MGLWRKPLPFICPVAPLFVVLFDDKFPTSWINALHPFCLCWGLTCGPAQFRLGASSPVPLMSLSLLSVSRSSDTCCRSSCTRAHRVESGPLFTLASRDMSRRFLQSEVLSFNDSYFILLLQQAAE